MTTYQLLDTIADAYNPLLFLGYIVFSVLFWRRGDRLSALRGFAGIVVAYGLMFIDNASNLWPSVGLDYSTHSAAALSLIAFYIHKRRWNSPAAMSFIASLVLYYALEVYQQYHSVLDIVTTAMVVGPIVALVYWMINKISASSSFKLA